jgi:hypothetical protein
MVGIRHSEQNAACVGEKVYELHEMDLEPPGERTRMLADIRSEVHGARLVNDEGLTKRIDGFPGAIARLKEDGFNILTAEHCREVLRAAHDLRYPEFDRLFEAASDDQKKLAARLACAFRAS